MNTMERYKENNIETVKNEQNKHKNVQTLHCIENKSKIRTRSPGDSLKDFPDEIRDFPMWAVTFIVLCLVCVSVAVIL